MISLNWDGMSGEVGALMARYAALPRHIAKKHLAAAMKRAQKIGLPVLKQATPVGKYGGQTRTTISRGEFKTQRKRGGALRRAATVNAKYMGRNRDGMMVGRLGYKYGAESRKAIWLEFGTKHIQPRQIMDGVHQRVKTPVSRMLVREMAKALEAATTELASNKNPGGAAGFRRKR